MLGQFGGLGELEKFITVTIGVYIAGRLVKNPRNRAVVAGASIFGVFIQQFMGCIVDILKVQFAVEDFEAVAGLPESVFFTEGFACLNDVLFQASSSVCFRLCSLYPKLYGKIEPLLGMKPRDEKTVLGSGGVSAKTVGICIIGFIAAVAAELLRQADLN